MTTTYPTIEQTVGNTPLVRLQRIPGAAGAARGNVILAKLEGNNPAGSVKDRPALSMIKHAEERGDIKPGDTLIEATSGNTGIALAMAAAMRGYRMILIMPDNLSVERRAAMTAYGAELILTPADKGGMEYARDLATEMQADGRGVVLDQFANPDNPRAHIETTGPEIWTQTEGRVTHFVSAMGTTGTIMGVSTYLKSRNPAVQVSARSRPRARRFPASANGRKPICPRSSTAAAWTPTSPSSRPRPKSWRAAWQPKKASSAASRRPARWSPPCAWPSASMTRPSSSSSATAATATCPRASSIPDAPRAGLSARPGKTPHVPETVRDVGRLHCAPGRDQPGESSPYSGWMLASFMTLIQRALSARLKASASW